MAQLARRGRFPVLLLVALLVPGAILMTIAIAAWALYKATETDDPRLESFRFAVAWHVAAQFGAAARPAIARAMISILNNEMPKAWTPGTPIIGDATLGGGPSIGPGQVYRKTAKDLGLWKPSREDLSDAEEREEYAALASGSEWRLVGWAVAVFKSKYQAAGGDVEDAIRRYNGGGDRAAKYRDNAVVFAAETFGGLES